MCSLGVQEMTEKDGVVEFRSSQSCTCPECGGKDVQTRYETEEFRYGVGEHAIAISVELPLRQCAACGFQYFDHVADETRHEAVCRALGVMTPQEIQAVRQAFGFSRREFSVLTGLGEASLGRWECGTLIQSQANDRYLYLLSVPENIERLRIRPERARLVDERIIEDSTETNVLRFPALSWEEQENARGRAAMFFLAPALVPVVN